MQGGGAASAARRAQRITPLETGKLNHYPHELPLRVAGWRFNLSVAVSLGEAKRSELRSLRRAHSERSERLGICRCNRWLSPDLLKGRERGARQSVLVRLNRPNIK
jgi:hypothetical protein